MKSVKMLRFALVLLIVSIMVSCGEQAPKEKVLNVSKVNISGMAKDYIAVVSGTYTMKVVDDKIILPVKFKLLQPIQINDKNARVGNIGLVPLDVSGVAIQSIGSNFSPSDISDWDKFGDLMSSAIGDEKIIVFKWDYFANAEEKLARIMNEAVSFEIVRTDFTNSRPAVTTVEKLNIKSDIQNEDVNINNDGLRNDWDDVLDKYEKYVSQYGKLMKKVQDGDSSAMTEYVEMLTTITELAEKLGSEDELSTTQMIRFTKLQMEMANVAMNM